MTPEMVVETILSKVVWIVEIRDDDAKTSNGSEESLNYRQKILGFTFLKGSIKP